MRVCVHAMVYLCDDAFMCACVYAMMRVCVHACMCACDDAFMPSLNVPTAKRLRVSFVAKTSRQPFKTLSITTFFSLYTVANIRQNSSAYWSLIC